MSGLLSSLYSHTGIMGMVVLYTFMLQNRASKEVGQIVFYGFMNNLVIFVTSLDPFLVIFLPN